MNDHDEARREIESWIDQFRSHIQWEQEQHMLHRLNMAYCEACQYAHGREHKDCRARAAVGPPSGPRIPDNDLSACTLHPGRKLIAHKLLASIEGLLEEEL